MLKAGAVVFCAHFASFKKALKLHSVGRFDLKSQSNLHIQLKWLVKESEAFKYLGFDPNVGLKEHYYPTLGRCLIQIESNNLPNTMSWPTLRLILYYWTMLVGECGH